jgi:hypothetical protein
MIEGGRFEATSARRVRGAGGRHAGPETAEAARAHPLLALQQAAGNRAVGSLVQALRAGRSATLAPPRIQRKCAACAAGATPCAGCSREDELSSAPRGVQARVAVGPVDDPLEREADQLAALVTGSAGPAPVARPSPGPHDQAQRAPSPEAAARPAAGAGLDHASALTSGGEPLPSPVRGFYEDRFGHDFEGVRVHVGGEAARRTEAIDALAFTYGHHVWLGRDQAVAPSFVLAHELAHVVQQTRPAQPSAPVVRRFGSPEHVQIGKNALPGQTVLIMGYGQVPFGEVIAMTGDFFESLQQMQDVARTGPAGKEQIDLVRWKVNGSAGAKPAVSAGVEDAVEDRYRRLAARNESHFSTGSSPGNSNRERYIDLHAKAIQASYDEAMILTYLLNHPSAPMVVPRFSGEALEASADHFLTDAFSAGHIRTPRGQVQSHWNAMYPNFTDNFVDLISCYMAAFVRDVDRPTVLGIPVSVGMIKDQIKPTIQSMAGAALANFGIGDLISIAMHDADNKGLDVVSTTGPKGSVGGRWRAVGDDMLYPKTASAAATATSQMVESAVKVSFAEVGAARSLGMGTGTGALSAMKNSANFRALDLIPREDTSAASTNPTFAWKAADIRALPTNLQKLVAAQLDPGTQVRNQLDALSVPACQGGAHAELAWSCFKSHLLSRTFEILALSCEGTTCPPGNNNPCAKPVVTACPP